MDEYAQLSNPLVHNVYDLVALVEMYKEDAINIFNYLNMKVNKFNKCQLSLCLFSNMNYAQFQYPNNINIFLGSIIDHYADGGRDAVLSILALCTTHELFHADQEVNGKRYKANAAYCNNVENAAQYNAEVFCYAHRNEFKKLFGFNYRIKVQNDFGTYTRASYKEYYANSLLGIFRNEDLYKVFVEKLLSSENFILSIRYETNDEYVGHMLKLKEGGVISENDATLSSYVSIMNELRRGIATCIYVFTYYTTSYEVSGRPFDVLDITIDKIEYNPILFG